MRLINTRRFVAEEQGILTDFHGDDIPPYAILSHTWEQEELLYEDVKRIEMLRTSLRGARGFTGDLWMPMELDSSIETNDRHTYLSQALEFYKAKAGYQKVLGTCKRALHDHYDFVWVDTCCIDKSSSAELQEAINSMWQWYEKFNICYVHLSDLDEDIFAGASSDDMLERQRTGDHPRWFTHGWTLQELLAPSDVVFHSRDWTVIGSLGDLAESIAALMHIPIAILRGVNTISTASIAQRMSWTANRSTSRIEDRAYSLLGIFQVDMPMLYGEEFSAFKRLQMEILRTSTDQSILAWNWETSALPFFEICHPLAPSPDFFVNCADIEIPYFEASPRDALKLKSTGLEIWTYLLPVDHETTFLLVLNCTLRKHPARIFALLVERIEAPIQPSHGTSTPHFVQILDPFGLDEVHSENDDIHGRLKLIDHKGLSKRLEGREPHLVTISSHTSGNGILQI